jgi:hypothetical protein
LTTLSALLLLGEDVGQPGAVDEVADTTEDSEEEEVQEDSIARVISFMSIISPPSARELRGRSEDLYFKGG